MPSFPRDISRSFRAAGRGVLLAFKAERTFRVMIAAGLAVIALICTLPLETWERLLLVLLTGSVLVLELVNSMVERLADLLKPRLSAYVGDIKDLMAAAVLIAAGFALLVGTLILAPHFLLLAQQI